MKKQLHIYITLAISFCVFGAKGQQLEISPNATIELYSNVSFYANGLTLKPSGTVALSGLIIEPKATLTNQTLGTAHISRTYSLGVNAPSFSGDIFITYLDQEINSLDEDALKLAVHDNNQWQYVTQSTTDIGTNTITAIGLSNMVIGELAIGVPSVLPLKWGTISAKRLSNSVRVAWQTENEYNVSHFILERSKDGTNWESTLTHVPAQNQRGRNVYELIDRPQSLQQLYYRVRQIDSDGRQSISAIATVNGTGHQQEVMIFPNPSSRIFTISGIPEKLVRETKIYDISGRLLKNWKGYQSNYEISDIGEGLHSLSITLIDGTIINQKLLIRR